MAVGDFDARLIVLSGPTGGGDTIALGGVPDLEIGKADQRHIRLAGTLVSRAHARLVRLDFGPSRWKVVDAGSTNGIFLNDERIAESELYDGDVLRIGEYELRFVTHVPSLSPPAAPAITVGNMLVAAKAVAGEVHCPSCRTVYPAKTKICVGCGIYVPSGRPLVISRELDENHLAARADLWIRVVSWFVPFGLFPIASEAFATKPARAIWYITGITVAASVVFFVPYYTGDMKLAAPWMMWTGRGSPIPTYELITSALIHAGIMHLAGNLVFLLVFGIRVNELIGDARMAIVYPTLAITSGLVDYVASLHEPLRPGLGASGAIMGLAGMYVVFFPVQKVVMAIWLRLTMFFGIRMLLRAAMGSGWGCWYRVFRMRGLWLLALWVGLNDVLPTVLAAGRQTRDHVAHWAHLGGFLTGAALAIGMLIARQANAHGSDLLSVVFGTRAWAILGKPADRVATP